MQCSKHRNPKSMCDCADCSVDICCPVAIAAHFNKTYRPDIKFSQHCPQWNPAGYIVNPAMCMKYTGDVKNKRPHGWGKCVFTGAWGAYVAGDILYGAWYKGKPHGIFHWYSGNKYVRGEMGSEYELDGYATEYIGDHVCFEGQFKSGKKDGCGKRYLGPVVIEGCWLGDMIQEIRVVQKNGVFVYFGAQIDGRQRGIQYVDQRWEECDGTVLSVIRNACAK